MPRKKTPTNLTQEENARQVAFSKRRTAIFKKASELCTLGGVEAAVVLFSPDGKASTFGYPSFEAIMKKYAGPGNPDNGYAKHMAEHEANIRNLKKQYSEMLQQLKAEKKRGEELKQMRKPRGKSIIDKPIEDLNLDELLKLQAFMQQAKANLLKHVEELEAQNSDPSASSSGISTEAVDPSVTKPKEMDADIHRYCRGVSRGD